MTMARDSLIHRATTASSLTTTAVPTRTASISTEAALDSYSHQRSTLNLDESPERKPTRSQSSRQEQRQKYMSQPPKGSPEGRARRNSHVDLCDAAAAQKQFSNDERQHANGIRIYGEDVAQRNLTSPPSPPWAFTYPLVTPNDDEEPEGSSTDGVPSQISRSNTRSSHYSVKNFSPIHETAFIAVVCCAQLLTQAGLAQSIAPLHIIGASFGTTDPAQLSWYPAAYSLTVGTFILPAGRLGDIYGHKKIFIIGWLWFCVFSLLCGFSIYVQQAGLKGAVFFCVCRAFQGIGPALILPNALAILGRTYEAGNKKNMTFALFGACAPGVRFSFHISTQVEHY